MHAFTDMFKKKTSDLSLYLVAADNHVNYRHLWMSVISKL